MAKGLLGEKWLELKGWLGGMSGQDVRVAGSGGSRSGAISVVSFPVKHPKITATVVLWLCGLFFMFLTPPLVRITPEMRYEHDEIMEEASKIETDLHQKYEKYLAAKAYTDSARVWFWRFRQEYRSLVKERKIPENEAWKVLMTYQKMRNEEISKAKSVLGVWSDAGIEESRGLFWNSYNSGKVFAQRQTLWDAMFTILNSRESDTVSRIIELIIIACVNFTTGMISALFLFVVRLPSMIASFKPGWISGVLFFGTASVGGASVVCTVLFMFYGGTATAIYALSGPQLDRLQNRQFPRRRVGMGHAHFS